ncbi:MAG: hypothetical protein GC149_20345 [Gammaproteobacteria bacterium]|nr:hypothetical protein [Gammaproteobacteria bacterium]
MLMQPLQDRLSRSQEAKSKSVPPPVGGWNARDALDQMKEHDAVLMDNWFPRQNDVIMRRGYAPFCEMSATANAVETLAEYHAGETRKFIACGSGSIDEVSSGTASNLGSGFSENSWQTTQFGGRLFLVNGTDDPQDYDGSSLSSTSWSGSGLTIAKLINVVAFKSRLYFVEKDSQKFWYGGVQSVTGTLTAFDLKYVGNFGGNLIAIGVISRDGGDGVDDLLACFMSSGEVVVYSGSDPGSDFSLVGVYAIGAPIGYRCTIKFGSDLVVITKDGYVPLTSVLPFGRSLKTERTILSDKISGAVIQAIETYGSNDGWEPILYPAGNMLIFNVPRTTTAYDQHVMNTRTRSWCRFRNIPARCWSLFNDNLYFGGPDGVVYRADTGKTDDGAAITCIGQQAWNYFGDRSHNKIFTMVRPVLEADNTPSAFLSLGTDFKDNTSVQSIVSGSEVNAAVWDEAIWDQAVWAGGNVVTQNWSSVSGIGYCASLRCKVAESNARVSWKSSIYAWKQGGII